jgi:SPP1 gp7 family putative phage head morphogenesis protein
MHGLPMRINTQTVELYANEVVKEVYKMHLDVSSQIESLFKSDGKKAIQKTENIALDASISSLARMLTNKLVDKWSKRFNTFGTRWTKSMISKVEAQSEKDLSKSMEKLSGGLAIKTDQISGKTRNNILASSDQAASLIKTIGQDYTTEVKQAVARAITNDASSFTELKSSIHNMLQNRYKKHKNKAYNVARDQMRKSYTNITASRMKDIGVAEYIWRHGGGVKELRSHHKNYLNGKTFSLDDPPVIDPSTGKKGKPGDDYFCSCYMEPVIRFGSKGS